VAMLRILSDIITQSCDIVDRYFKFTF